MAIQQIRFELDCAECIAWQNATESYVCVPGKPTFLIRSFIKIQGGFHTPEFVLDRIVRVLPQEVSKERYLVECSSCGMSRFEIVCYEAE